MQQMLRRVAACALRWADAMAVSGGDCLKCLIAVQPRNGEQGMRPACGGGGRRHDRQPTMLFYFRILVVLVLAWQSLVWLVARCSNRL
jgi:hypothetical protein